MKKCLPNLLLTLFVFLSSTVLADHIVGGELFMRPTGSAGAFEITLIQYWDQNNLIVSTPFVNGNRDDEATLYIYRKRNNELVDRVDVRYISAQTIQYQNKACASVRSLNTTMGTYKGNITLPAGKYSDPEGYYMIWERCCRNNDIDNIVAPGDAGMVFYLEFPPVSIVNSAPRFAAPNGQYICANRSFSMNMSATDADGDELRYSMVTPIRGNTSSARPMGDDSFKSGYPLIEWSNGISVNNAIPGPKPLTINNSGMLTVTAGSLGLYVFAIQCAEYRNGVKIGEVRRDFQLLVIDCNDDQPEQPVIMMNAQPVSQVLFCPEKSVTLETEDASDWSYQWQRNGLNIPGATSASVMVSDTGIYSVVKSYTQKCSRDTSSQMVDVRYAPPIEATISADKAIICDDDVVTLTANGGYVANEMAISWARDNNLMETMMPVLKVTEGGSYLLKIADPASGCFGTDTMFIGQEMLQVRLPERKGVVEGSSTKLVPAISPANPAYTYLWSPPEGMRSAADEQDAVVAPSNDTKYTLTVESDNGCIVQASTEVYVIDKMHIPTSFTPNNDGRNDRFEIFNAKGQIVEMRIYNRWGEVIFASKGYDEPWNGNYRDNTPVPAGTYPYTIKTNEQEVSGTVMLLK